MSILPSPVPYRYRPTDETRPESRSIRSRPQIPIHFLSLIQFSLLPSHLLFVSFLTTSGLREALVSLFHIIPFLSPTMLSLPVSLSIQLSCPIGRHERAKEGTRSRPPCHTRSGASETEGELLIRGVQLFTMSFEAARIFTQVTPTARASDISQSLPKATIVVPKPAGCPPSESPLPDKK